MVARQFWELDAAGSSPVTPTKKTPVAMATGFFSLVNEKDLNLKKAYDVKKNSPADCFLVGWCADGY